MSPLASDKESVLVVDDVPLNLEVIVEYLIDAGFEVFVATNGEEALEQLNLVKTRSYITRCHASGIRWI